MLNVNTYRMMRFKESLKQIVSYQNKQFHNCICKLQLFTEYNIQMFQCSNWLYSSTKLTLKLRTTFKMKHKSRINDRIRKRLHTNIMRTNASAIQYKASHTKYHKKATCCSYFFKNTICLRSCSNIRSLLKEFDNLSLLM